MRSSLLESLVVLPLVVELFPALVPVPLEPVDDCANAGTVQARLVDTTPTQRMVDSKILFINTPEG